MTISPLFVLDNISQRQYPPLRYNVTTSVMPLSNFFIIRRRTNYNSSSEESDQLQTVMPIAALANFYIFGSAILSFMVVYAMMSVFQSQ